MRLNELLASAGIAALSASMAACGGGAAMAPSPASAVAPAGGAYPGTAGAPVPVSAPMTTEVYRAQLESADGSEPESDRTVADNAPPPAPVRPPAAPPPPTSTQPKPPPVAQDAPHVVSMLIYTATLNLAVFQVTEQMDKVESIGRAIGGYLAVRNDTQITIRVPRERFDEALAQIEKLGDVLHRSVTAEDVTDQFMDLEVRLKNARAVRDQLQALLAKAGVKDALEIEKELGRVTESIEQMEGRLKLLRDKIAFSTITVTFQPVETQTVRDTTLPFPWLQDLGLSSLLNVH
jgi:hypothetical protein